MNSHFIFSGYPFLCRRPVYLKQYLFHLTLCTIEKTLKKKCHPTALKPAPPPFTGGTFRFSIVHRSLHEKKKLFQINEASIQTRVSTKNVYNLASFRG